MEIVATEWPSAGQVQIGEAVRPCHSRRGRRRSLLRLLGAELRAAAAHVTALEVQRPADDLGRRAAHSGTMSRGKPRARMPMFALAFTLGKPVAADQQRNEKNEKNK